MRQTLIILFVFLFFGQAFAQDQDKKALADSLYHEALDSIHSSRYKPAYEKYSAARDLYKEMNKPEYEFYCLLRMGDCAEVFNDIAKSYFNYLKALKLADSIDDKFRDLRHFLVYKPIIEIQEQRDSWKDLLELTYNLDSLVRYSLDSRLMICNKVLLAEKALQKHDSINSKLYLDEAERLYEMNYKLDDYDYNLRLNLYNDKKFIDSNSPFSIYRLTLFDYYLDMQELIYDTYISYFCLFRDWDNAKEKAMSLINKRKEFTPYYYNYYTNLINIGLLKEDSVMAYSALDTFKYEIEKDTTSNIFDWYVYHINAYRIDSYFLNYDSAFDNINKAIECFNSLYLSYNAYDISYYDILKDFIDLTYNSEDIKNYYYFCKNRYGEYSSNTAEAYCYMGVDEELQNNMESSLYYYSNSCDIYIKLFSSRFKYLSSDNRTSYWNDCAQSMVNMIGALLQTDNKTDDYVEKSYNTLLTLKGCLLAGEKSLAESVYESGDSVLIKMYNEVQSSGLFDNNSQSNKNQSSEKYSWDTEFLYKSSMLRYSDFLNIDYDSIRRKLQPNEYVVDFFDYLEKDSVSQYVAYVYNKNSDCPYLMKVFTEEKLDSIKSKVNANTENNLHYLYLGQSANDVINLVWEPIRKEINIPKDATVFFVPSGSLHQLAIESLPIKGDYKFIRLSSAREVINRKPKLVIDKDKTPNAVLYGGLQYDVDSVTMKIESDKFKEEIPSFLANIRGDESLIKGWGELKGTGKEVEAVYNILQTMVPNVKTYTGSEGTEESFLCLHDHAPQILLMSTHGFYYTPDDAQKREYLKGFTDAMSLSGLILSGGNRAWRGDSIPEGVLPGILTAEKISQINLDGLDLVVLSACKTGHGSVTVEGINGLQSAFKKAGAGTIVMTLWKVDDNATKDFMIEFFKNLVNNDWNKRDAFDKAKAAIRSKDEYKDPYYWAAFVMLD